MSIVNSGGGVGFIFHYFHQPHQKSIIPQASFTVEEFDNLLARLERSGVRLLEAGDFEDRVARNMLQVNDRCLTFDDGLACQRLILDVLSRRNLTAFFFPITSFVGGEPNQFEIARQFMNQNFSTAEEYYESFLGRALSLRLISRAVLAEGPPNDFMSRWSFHSSLGRLYRFARDVVLTRESTWLVLESMAQALNFDLSVSMQSISMTPSDLQELVKRGHRVGLHSHVHDNFDRLSVDMQLEDIATNWKQLEAITGESPTVMSYPMGRYSNAVLNFLENKGIHLAFRSENTSQSMSNRLLVGRVDSRDLKEL
jgi:peptidoglycan/xylan/chitin deacetylase (PgdA/CDA1 family)